MSRACEAWNAGFDTAVNWGNGKVYIFKGDEYVRYDIVSDRVDGGYPKPIATNWPGLMRLVDWVNWSAKLPDHAISIGREPDNSTHFLCAAVDGNAIYPGKLWSRNNSCYYADDKREVKTSVYAVATTKLPITWTTKTSAPSDRLIPVGVSPAGRTYYLCRARFANGVHPGRIETLSGACTIPYNGRSHALNDGFEIAIAPTTVNFPNIPHIVRMLSPLSGSDKFKDVCAAEVTFLPRDTVAAARYPSHLPDIKTLVQIVSRNTCAMLYKRPSEVPKYARKIEVVIEDHEKHRANAYVFRHDAHCTLGFNSRVFPPNGPNVMYVVTLIYHEATHTTQQSDYGPNRAAFNEGVADYILFKAWERRIGTPGGDWKKGYDMMAYFLMWLERRYPDIAYKVVMSAATKERIGHEIIRRLTGRPIDELWQEYLAKASPARLTEPESLLTLSPFRRPDTPRIVALPPPVVRSATTTPTATPSSTASLPPPQTDTPTRTATPTVTMTPTDTARPM